jgi:hypothetical protein
MQAAAAVAVAGQTAVLEAVALAVLRELRVLLAQPT